MNDILNGLMGGELVVVAGQPGMGKSALMGSLAYEWAQRGIASGFVALEMKAVDIQNRLLQRLFRKSLAKEMKYLTKEERVEFSKAVASFAKLPIFFVDNGNSTLSAVATSIKTMHMLYGIKVAFVDYLQLMRTSGGETRDTEIGIMTRTLKQLAMELNIPVIIGSQLNRRTENNEDGRPRLSNLRESGNIEQDADIVAFVYRPIFYAPKGRKKKGDETEEVSEHDFEIIVSKQRNGMLGTIHLKYNTERQIISEV
jgi:replicative DNA helicase